MRFLFIVAFIILLTSTCWQCKSKKIVKKEVDSSYIAVVDSLVNDAISKQAFPGCRIFAVKNRKVFLDKCYGFLTYDSIVPVKYNTLYDLASITKVAAAAPCVMKLYEDGVLDLEQKFSYYFSAFSDSIKDSITVKEMLAHQAGLKAGINFSRRTLDKNGDFLSDFYFNKPTNNFCLKVCDSLYINSKIKDIIYQSICKSEISGRGNYLYSDLPFYLLPSVIEQFSGKTIDQYLYDNFYLPLGLKTMCFNPLEKFSKDEIAPTEIDTIFRKRLIQGYVHDEGAALCGGISAHAGLFSSAKDLGVLFQMFMNKGVYNKQRYFKDETVEMFTSQVFENNRRGIIFDKPPLDKSLNATPSKKASSKSYGHTGFTGPFVWADPENGLLVVFLCNSTYPNRSNMLVKLDFRTKLHDILYKMTE